jgi:hypothetical protein
MPVATGRIFEDREQTVGASEVGQYARKLFWIKNEGDPLYAAPRNADHVDRWGARVRGSIFEEQFWLPAMRARFGEKLKYAGREQQTLVADFLGATPDGLLVNQAPDVLTPLGIRELGGDGSLFVECKTSDPRTKRDEPKPEHCSRSFAKWACSAKSPLTVQPAP